MFWAEVGPGPVPHSWQRLAAVHALHRRCWIGSDGDGCTALACMHAVLVLLQYVKVGIADPAINWIDLGASRRSAKTAIGFTGHPVR